MDGDNWRARQRESQLDGKLKTVLQMFGIAFMVYQNDFMGIDIYGSALSCWCCGVMTIWSMMIYLRAAWPFIIEIGTARRLEQSGICLDRAAKRLKSRPSRE